MKPGNTDHRPLYKMFNEVPEHYDLLNRMITWRFDEAWRKKAAEECLKNKPIRFLDLCTGTGDLVVRISNHPDSPDELKGLDFSQPMLDIAVEKTKKYARKPVDYILADASNIPFEDGYFDSIGISFAFRNLTFHNPLKDKSLSEIHRVLADGGRFVILESSQPKSRIWRSIYHFYLRVYVKKIGGLISGYRGAYNYLAHSASNYFTAEEIKEMLMHTGFKKVTHKHLMWGVAAIHVAEK